MITDDGCIANALERIPRGETVGRPPSIHPVFWMLIRLIADDEPDEAVRRQLVSLESRLTSTGSESQVTSVNLALFFAEHVIGLFAARYPDDEGPLVALQAARDWLRNPTGATAVAAYDAALAAGDSASRAETDMTSAIDESAETAALAAASAAHAAYFAAATAATDIEEEARAMRSDYKEAVSEGHADPAGLDYDYLAEARALHMERAETAADEAITAIWNSETFSSLTSSWDVLMLLVGALGLYELVAPIAER